MGLKTDLHHFPWSFLMSKLSFVAFTVLKDRAESWQLDVYLKVSFTCHQPKSQK